MGIKISENKRVFNIQTVNSSYIIGIHKSGVLLHYHYGMKVNTFNVDHLIINEFRENLTRNDQKGTYTYHTLPMELGFFGNGDYRTPSIQIADESGARINEFVYKSHQLIKGKPTLKGLPSTYDSAGETLIITLEDTISNIEVNIMYHVFDELDTITRSIEVKNNSMVGQDILKLMSLSMDLRDSDYEFVHLAGRWGCERQLKSRRLIQGIQSIESRSGISSHIHSPFFILKREETSDFSGEAYGFSLCYSGNFLSEIEVSEYSTTRVHLGINPFEFSWHLESGKSFQAPEVVMAYTSEGLNKMSQAFHTTVKKHLLRFNYKDTHRPTLINNWEATYFDFNESKLLELAKTAADCGIELFVLDDGWFGNRNSDRTSLGDWYVNYKKLPSGLEGLSSKIHALGMKFGIWFEPEMLSKESELYEAHPDWAVQISGRKMTEERNQYLLDYTKEEVRAYIINAISNILDSGSINYVKWDMNRKVTESYLTGYNATRQKEFGHRYMLGVYEVMEEVTSKYPDILFEGCASGGGRFDMGMLYYMPQFWTSDNTDAFERLKIQYTTSLFFPQVTMGAHVSEVPNHQVLRSTTLDTRTNTAFIANLGYELDMTKMDACDLETISRDVERYKELRQVLQYGTFYRLKNPFKGNTGAWQSVSSDKRVSVVYIQRLLASANMRHFYLKMTGLKEDFIYVVNNGEFVMTGEALMHIGIPVKLEKGDFKTRLYIMKEKQ